MKTKRGQIWDYYFAGVSVLSVVFYFAFSEGIRNFIRFVFDAAVKVMERYL